MPSAGRLTTEPREPAGNPGDPGLKRELNFFSLTASGVGLIIGAGIYVLVGTAAAEAGNAVWLAFLLAAALSALTGLGYCELASMYPRAAAEFEYSRHAFPPWVAFLTGWMMFFGLAVGAGTVSLGFARYLAEFVDVPLRLGALSLILLVATIASTGLKNSVRVTVALSLVQVGGLLVVIFVGLPHVGETSLVDDISYHGVAAAAALVFFAFIGFDEVATLAEETHNPSRTVPLALLAGLAISTLLYLAVAVTAVSVLGAEALGRSSAPLADVVREATGNGFDRVVSGVALLSTINTTLLMLTAGSRVLYGMGEAKALPTVIGAVSGSRRVPRRAILLITVLGGAFALVGDLRLAASFTDFAVYLVFLSVNATVVVLRYRLPRAPRPFSVPGAVGRLPVIPVLGFATTIFLMTRLEFDAILVGAAISAVGLVAGYFFAQRTGWDKPAAQVAAVPAANPSSPGE